MRVNRYGNGWENLTDRGQEIGVLSRKGTDELWRRGVLVNQFQFQQGEVSVRSIFRHIKLNDITREIEEDWFVVIPQIRVCR